MHLMLTCHLAIDKSRNKKVTFLSYHILKQYIIFYNNYANTYLNVHNKKFDTIFIVYRLFFKRLASMTTKNIFQLFFLASKNL